MILFKLRRKLAELGIGDPLLTLLKTTEEIKNMTKLEKIIKPITNFKNTAGKYAIEYGMQEKYKQIPGFFRTEDDARKWALWNYKGRTDCWRIILIQKNVSIIT